MDEAALSEVIKIDICWHKKCLGKAVNCIRTMAILDYQRTSQLTLSVAELT